MWMRNARHQWGTFSIPFAFFILRFLCDSRLPAPFYSALGLLLEYLHLLFNAAVRLLKLDVCLLKLDVCLLKLDVRLLKLIVRV
jgi:hypothetical protein